MEQFINVQMQSQKQKSVIRHELNGKFLLMSFKLTLRMSNQHFILAYITLKETQND